MKRFVHRPQTALLRRALFQLHLWVGIAAGVYIFIVCTTGAALMFRIDMQRAAFPHLFTPGNEAPPADAAAVLDSVARTYPEFRVSGIDAPTTTRPTVLAYVTRDDEFRTVLADPASGRVLGELPKESFVTVLQDLHFDLFGGRTGRIVNGIGGFALLAMCLTGIVVWWPGIASWRRALLVDPKRGWKRVNWELHSAAGFWTAAFVAMWAVTGIYFAFPSAFRSAVHAVSPLTDERAPVSDVTMRHRQPPPTWRALIEIAKREMPSRPLARVILPAHDRAAFQVGFVDRLPMPAGTADVETVYLDQYTGAVLAPPGPMRRSVGDIVMAWVAPLHMGSFGGMPVKVLWLLLGLAPPLLFVTGAVMWWNRVLRERRGRWFASSRARAQRSAHDPMPRART